MQLSLRSGDCEECEVTIFSCVKNNVIDNQHVHGLMIPIKLVFILQVLLGHTQSCWLVKFLSSFTKQTF